MSNEYDQVHSIRREEFENVWDVFKELGLEERHFNELESGYRTLASTWLLAAFGAVGFVITKSAVDIPIDRFLIIAGIGLAASIGVFLLWNLDLMVYHQLLAACFTAGLLLEQKYSWLPAIRTNMMARMRGKGVLPRVIWFYVAGNTVSLAISALGLTVWASRYGSWQGVVVAVIYCLAIGVCGWYMISATEAESGSTRNDGKPVETV